jgi:hypothetical protein
MAIAFSACFRARSGDPRHPRALALAVFWPKMAVEISNAYSKQQLRVFFTF